MEPLKTYDYLALARERVFGWVRPLGAAQYTQAFPAWRRTLAATLTHVMTSEWYYIQRLQGRDVPPYEQWPIREEDAPPFAALEEAWTGQAARTREALRTVSDWGAAREYRVTGDDGRPAIVTATAADIFTQLVLHEMHHRAQAMNMLQQLGVTMGDIDYNTVMYKRREA
jgi:uncharacterized damage-inducible protein DinB